VVTTADDAGLALVVPAGAVPVATQFRVLRDLSNDKVPSDFPVYRLQPESRDVSATPPTVTAPASSACFTGSSALLTLCTRVDQDALWQARPNTVLNSTARTVSATVPRLGEFVAWEGNLHRLFTQEMRIYNPAVPVATEFLNG